VSKDAIGFRGSAFNIYRYFSASPLNSVDPSGTLDKTLSVASCAAAKSAAGVPVGTIVAGGAACGAVAVTSGTLGYCVTYYPSKWCGKGVC